VVKPCNPKRSPPFTETRQPDRAAGPIHALQTLYRWPLKRWQCPLPSLAVASALLFRGLEGWPLYRDLRPGGRRCLRYGTLLKRRARRSLIVVSIRLV
jgi:hypothetical protein